MTSAKESPTKPTASEYDQLQSEYIRVRREMMRWRFLAQLHEDRLMEVEPSLLWRGARFLIHLLDLRHYWKSLLLLGLLSIFAIPFLPLLALMLVFPAGRELLLAAISKVQPVYDLLRKIAATLRTLKKTDRSENLAHESLVYQRPGSSHPPPADNKKPELQHLLQQLSPQNRQKIQRFQLTRQPLVRASEIQDRQSLSQTETSFLKVCIASTTDRRGEY
jgi:hypothetical protein